MTITISQKSLGYSARSGNRPHTLSENRTETEIAVFSSKPTDLSQYETVKTLQKCTIFLY